MLHPDTSRCYEDQTCSETRFFRNFPDMSQWQARSRKIRPMAAILSRIQQNINTITACQPWSVVCLTPDPKYRPTEHSLLYSGPWAKEPAKVITMLSPAIRGGQVCLGSRHCPVWSVWLAAATNFTDGVIARLGSTDNLYFSCPVSFDSDY